MDFSAFPQTDKPDTYPPKCGCVCNANWTHRHALHDDDDDSQLKTVGIMQAIQCRSESFLWAWQAGMLLATVNSIEPSENTFTCRDLGKSDIDVLCPAGYSEHLSEL